METESNWKRIVITPSSDFFPIYAQEIKKVPSGTESYIVTVINKKRSKVCKKECKEQYKFIFDWQSPDIAGIELFKFMGEVA